MNGLTVVIGCLIFALIAMTPVGISATANETETPAVEHEEHEARYLAHRLAIFTGNSLVPDGETRSGVLVVPTFGLDYQYWFAHRFAAMASFEIELLNYRVETKDGVFVDRDTPVVLVALGVFEAAKRLGLLLGPGVELERHESLWLIRCGGEYAFPVQNNYDLSIAAYADIKERFWSLTFGLSIGKRI